MSHFKIRIYFNVIGRFIPSSCKILNEVMSHCLHLTRNQYPNLRSSSYKSTYVDMFGLIDRSVVGYQRRVGQKIGEVALDTKGVICRRGVGDSLICLPINLIGLITPCHLESFRREQVLRVEKKKKLRQKASAFK